MKLWLRSAGAVLVMGWLLAACREAVGVCEAGPLTPDCVAELLVTVTVDGMPTSGIPVMVTGASSASATTDATGIATFSDLVAGVYTASVNDPGIVWDNTEVTVTLPEGGSGAASFTGTGLVERIAFVSDRDGNNEVYSMRTDGSDVQRLTTESEEDRAPSWSPDGARIAFHSKRGGGEFNIWTMNADGTSPTRLTFSPSSEFAGWNPGPRITFASDHGGNLDIYMVNANGSEVRQITTDTDRDQAPNWSPQGDSIAFQSDRTGAFEIFKISSQGGTAIQLTNTGNRNLTPAWSPDGSQIAFASERDGVGTREIYVMNADGSAQTRLTTDNAVSTSPAWSPDGLRIAYQSDRDGDIEIYIIEVSSGAIQQVTSNTGDDSQPEWGPPLPVN